MFSIGYAKQKALQHTIGRSTATQVLSHSVALNLGLIFHTILELPTAYIYSKAVDLNYRYLLKFPPVSYCLKLNHHLTPEAHSDQPLPSFLVLSC